MEVVDIGDKEKSKFFMVIFEMQRRSHHRYHNPPSYGSLLF